MRNLLLFSALVIAVYQYVNWKPSTLDIASGMDIGEDIQFQGQTFQSDWSVTTESIDAYVRRIDRHYDENFPLITYDFVLTTGEYNDPDIVSIRHKGGGNYYWSAKKQPKGTLITYHLIPESSYAQGRIDNIAEGETIKMSGKISQDSKITSSTGAFLALRHDNHKFILVDEVNTVF